MNIEYKSMKLQCTGISLISIGKQRPVRWGNYWYAKEINNSKSPEYRIVNMWYENWERINQNLFNYTPIGCYVYDHKFILFWDDNIPENYYYNKLCFTGGDVPQLDVIKHMYSIVGDPTNELEEFTDPESYYAKRNSTYDIKTGIITHHPQKG